MIYIEKNDKPNFLIEKIFNLIKVQENTIILPINEKRNNSKTNRKNSRKNKK